MNFIQSIINFFKPKTIMLKEIILAAVQLFMKVEANKQNVLDALKKFTAWITAALTTLADSQGADFPPIATGSKVLDEALLAVSFALKYLPSMSAHVKEILDEVTGIANDVENEVNNTPVDHLAIASNNLDAASQQLANMGTNGKPVLAHIKTAQDAIAAHVASIAAPAATAKA